MSETEDEPKCSNFPNVSSPQGLKFNLVCINIDVRGHMHTHGHTNIEIYEKAKSFAEEEWGWRKE